MKLVYVKGNERVAITAHFPSLFKISLMNSQRALFYPLVWKLS